MSETIPLLPTYASMVWTGISIVVVVVVFFFHICVGEDSTEQLQFTVLLTDRSHFTQFLFALFCFNTKIYTTLEFIYAIIFSLIQFDTDNPWPHLSSVGG
jgi:hypothetical protein